MLTATSGFLCWQVANHREGQPDQRIGSSIARRAAQAAGATWNASSAESLHPLIRYRIERFWGFHRIGRCFAAITAFLGLCAVVVAQKLASRVTASPRYAATPDSASGPLMACHTRRLRRTWWGALLLAPCLTALGAIPFGSVASPRRDQAYWIGFAMTAAICGTWFAASAPSLTSERRARTLALRTASIVLFAGWTLDTALCAQAAGTTGLEDAFLANLATSLTFVVGDAGLARWTAVRRTSGSRRWAVIRETLVRALAWVASFVYLVLAWNLVTGLFGIE